MRTLTPTAELIELKLGEDLTAYVAGRRARGRSWRLIARDIFQATGQDVTHETVRSWFPDDIGRAADSRTEELRSAS